MTAAHFQKLPGGILSPVSDEDKAKIDKVKAGNVVKVRWSLPRNYAFHKKFFALVKFAFDYWEPPEIEPDPEQKWRKKITPEKNIERFRKDLIILAGYYESYYRVDGTVRIEAKSIAFGNMSQEKFDKLYSAVHKVILDKVCTQFTDKMLDDVVEMAMSFAA